MEWLSAIRSSIEYIEAHLSEDISAQDISAQVYISPYILSKGFAVMTGYTVSEYVRNRRLYLAALDLVSTDKSIISIALDSGYDTPESFTKAFSRYHGSTPTAVRQGAAYKTFLPLRIKVTVQGGDKMEYSIKKMPGLRLIGFQKEFSFDNSYTEVPKFWDEVWQKHMSAVYSGKTPGTACEKAVADNRIGEFAVCIDDIGGSRFRYLIAGKYSGGEVPEGMTLYEFPMCEWAVFDCVGPIPEAFQSLNTRIFREWLPGNPEFELSGNATVEWYDPMNTDTSAPDCHSAIWIPVKRKN